MMVGVRWWWNLGGTFIENRTGVENLNHGGAFLTSRSLLLRYLYFACNLIVVNLIY
jgi:hypothetical protein